MGTKDEEREDKECGVRSEELGVGRGQATGDRGQGERGNRKQATGDSQNAGVTTTPQSTSSTAPLTQGSHTQGM